MIDTIKKAILAGVGAATLTTEKAEKALGELVDRGKLTATEASEAARKISDEGKKEFDEATRKVQESFDDVLARIGRGHRERLDSLETKVGLLEARLAKLEKSAAGKEEEKQEAEPKTAAQKETAKSKKS